MTEDENEDGEEEKQDESDALKDTATDENETPAPGETESNDVGKSSNVETLEKPKGQRNDETSGQGVETEAKL